MTQPRNSPAPSLRLTRRGRVVAVVLGVIAFVVLLALVGSPDSLPNAG